MATIKLKGIHKVKAKGRDYYYAWRGGPKLDGEPGSGEFMDSYNEAIASRTMPDTAKFRSLVVIYKGSPDYAKLADSTKRQWSRWLDRIADHFGTLSIAQFDRPQKIRSIIRKWRGTYAQTPRTADYGMQVLSRVLSYAVDPLGKITSNPCEGIKQIYGNDRAAIIWTDEDIKQLKTATDDKGKTTCSLEVGLAVDLAAHTGLRVSDLVRLSWSHVGEDAIVITTGKSNHKREAVIPLYEDLRTLLDRIPKRSPVILTSSRETPWTSDGLASSFHTAKTDAGMKGKDLHFHDFRGTAATKFYTAGLPERVIAEILGWEEDSVAKIIRRYVDRTAATKAIIRQIDEARKRT
ncbi:tyrosine-type recombinase/integrase [Phyllobacterium sp. BT25]|uniref:Tyrosine-type recombinase/integrase n=1 Tax=Phyllobacterium pellucidum TaxID=2740464 RepID=A0A849VS51_9HYPH|nr:tyrosine-type recombinase/integrase [Phyllobacterium pellucidum]NTS30713.1 tyrosine-type recombinase/integrase [Phyllobacterium pellucidum]